MRYGLRRTLLFCPTGLRQFMYCRRTIIHSLIWFYCILSLLQALFLPACVPMIKNTSVCEMCWKGESKVPATVDIYCCSPSNVNGPQTLRPPLHTIPTMPAGPAANDHAMLCALTHKTSIPFGTEYMSAAEEADISYHNCCFWETLQEQICMS